MWGEASNAAKQCYHGDRVSDRRTHFVTVYLLLRASKEKLYSAQTAVPTRALGCSASRVTSLLSYGSNRPQGLLGLAGDGKSNSTLLLCGKLWSDPESEWAQSPAGGCKPNGGCSGSSPSSSPSASGGPRGCGCPPGRGGSCIMLSTSESSDWLKR